MDNESRAGSGRYQVWHANDIEGVHLSRMEREPYRHGYTLVADVEARDLQHAVELTVHADRAWWLNPEVKISVVGARSTAAGDVIFDPRGQGYRFEGYRTFTQFEVADQFLPSPADLVEQNDGASQQRQDKQGVSPADLIDGQGTAPGQHHQNQIQRQGQSHSIGM
jgi:hypothetical protein